MSENENIKKYSGYGYHGGGRKAKAPEERRVALQISGSREELDQLRALAEAAGKNTSQYILDELVRK